MSKRQQAKDKQIVEGKIFAILSYLCMLCIIPLIFKKDNEFVLKHGKQGLVIFVAEVAVFIIHIILGMWIFRIGMFVLGVVSFIGIVNVLQGQFVKLPIIGDLAESITL